MLIKPENLTQKPFTAIPHNRTANFFTRNNSESRLRELRLLPPIGNKTAFYFSFSTLLNSGKIRLTSQTMLSRELKTV